MDAATADAKAPPSKAARTYMLIALFVVYAFNFIDRSIINTVGQAIKVDLGISDFQLGLMGGLSFALLYTALGIPIAWLADRFSRVWIITASLTAWSLMTAACGLVTNYGQMLAARIGVGIGEAGGSPPSHSLIADLYPAGGRAKAMAVFALGIPVGVMFGAVAGGWITQEYGWRMAFFIVGLPGLLLALIFRLTTREPARVGLTKDAASTMDVLRLALTKPSFFNLALGGGLTAFLSYGFLQFLHPVMVRNYAIAYADAALIVAMVQGVAAGFGTFFGGWLADHLGKKNVRFQALTPMIGCLCAGPLFAIGLLQPSITMAAIFFCAASFFHSFHYAPVFATIQDIMPARMRALAAAIMLFVLNLVGMGLGPMVVGAMSDFFTAQNFAPPPMGDALDYATACAHRVLPGMEKACAAASGSGLRQAMLIALLVYGWAALHYVLAARTLPKDCEPRG